MNVSAGQQEQACAESGIPNFHCDTIETRIGPPEFAMHKIQPFFLFVKRARRFSTSVYSIAEHLAKQGPFLVSGDVNSTFVSFLRNVVFRVNFVSWFSKS